MEKEDKSKYLIKNIFILENNSQLEHIDSPNNNINFVVKQLDINSTTLGSINISNNFTLFNKRYKNDERQKIKHKYNKLIYFCYRRNIFPIKNRFNVGVSRDSGWGCMIRCGQMIMSHAIYKYLKSKKYSSENAIAETIKLFLDKPYSLSSVPSSLSSLISKNPYKTINNNTLMFPPFSIHIHCLLGQYYNKYAGEWFSDVNLCQNYRDINNILNIFPDLGIFSFINDLTLPDVLDDCFTVITDEKTDDNNINKIINYNNKKYKMKKSGIIFISVRLGINSVTEDYYSSLKKLFGCKECIGIIGGETNLAHYFIGYNGKGNLVYLDPHITRDAVNILNDETITNDYLVKDLHEISISDMSTGLSVGFLFRTKNEFEDLIKFIEDYSKDKYPCFGFIKEKVEIDINNYENLFNDEDDF